MIETVIKAGKPIVGHSLIYDIAFTVEQFMAEMPPTFEEFSKLWMASFPLTFDTKSLAYIQKFGRSDLDHLFYKMTTDKKYNNNLQFGFDKEGH